MKVEAMISKSNEKDDELFAQVLEKSEMRYLIGILDNAI